jgi:hypothetical protein
LSTPVTPGQGGERRTPSAVRRRPKLKDRLDEATIAAIVEAYESGTPTTVMTERYQLGKGTILKLLREQGVVLRNPRFAPERIPEATQLYKDGWSLARLGERYGCDATVVRRALLAAGVTLRPRPGWS